MINLLPPEDKKSLVVEKNKKLAMVIGYIAIISLVCLALILYSLKFYILQDIDFQKTVLSEIEKQYQTQDTVSLKETVEKYNTILVQLNDFYKKETYANDFLKNMGDLDKSQGLYFTTINISRNKEDNTLKAVVYGVSDTRDTLLLLKNNLEGNTNIKNVNFPPNNWIKSKNINFSVTFEASQ